MRCNGGSGLEGGSDAPAELVETEQLLGARALPGAARWARRGCYAVGTAVLLGLVALRCSAPWSVGESDAHPSIEDSLSSKANYDKFVQLFRARAGNSSSFLRGPGEVAKARQLGQLPEVDAPNFKDIRELRAYWGKRAHAEAEATARAKSAHNASNETVTDTYLRVSSCMCDASLAALKFASAILNIEAAIHVCPKIAQLKRGQGRRLTSAVAGGAAVKIDKKEQAEMSCIANLQGMISGFTAVSQYVSGSIMDCPEFINALGKNRAGCSLGISVLLSGITKSGAAASDVDWQCRDPQTTNYSLPIAPGRHAVTTAGCIVNVGQATTYLAKIGLAIDGIVKNCQRPAIEENWHNQAKCTNSVGGEFANIGQVATYLGAAANACGKTILVPFGCANRLAAIVTGLADIAQGAGTIQQYCVPWNGTATSTATTSVGPWTKS